MPASATRLTHQPDFTMDAPGDPPPRVGVVIAVHNAVSVIAACLAALEAQEQRGIVEIIVADSSDDGTADIVRKHFPNVRLLHFETALGIPQLRGKGIAVSRGEIIAVLDPYSIVDADWLSELLRVHAARPNLIIGGAVELFDAAGQDLLTWTQYINEYGMFMLPMSEGEMGILPGSNISYKRAVLFDGDTPRYIEFWKTFVNLDTEGAGSLLWFAPSVVVRLDKPIPFRDFLRTRFDHGRCFAGMRVAPSHLAEQLWRAATTPLIPLVLTWRWGRRYWPKRRYRRKFILTLPLQLLLFGIWALGEFVGYCRGPGQSCTRLFY